MGRGAMPVFDWVVSSAGDFKVVSFKTIDLRASKYVLASGLPSSEYTRRLDNIIADAKNIPSSRLAHELGNRELRYSAGQLGVPSREIQLVIPSNISRTSPHGAEIVHRVDTERASNGLDIRVFYTDTSGTKFYEWYPK
jgi:hypothetical protein